MPSRGNRDLWAAHLFPFMRYMHAIRPRSAILAVAIALLALAFATPAQSAWVVKGRGFGHGVGLSQYGALGFAKQGRAAGAIVRHYYKNVRIRPANTRNLRVLITSGVSSVPFTGATRACGKQLKENRTYSFARNGSRVIVRRPNGSRLTGCGSEGAARGGGSVRYVGVGAYRGALLARAVGSSLYAINRVGIEGYVRGVIPNEVPTSWPQAALRAQAIAARSYALASRLNGNGYDLYDDTRSQVYGGRSSETVRTNKASKATARKVIKHGGKVVAGYFFSSSGGRTENSEFGFSGGSPRPYLKSVRDPFDNVSPHHRWRLRFTNAQMAASLSGLFQGKLRRIRVLETGRSPRIVRARVVGSKGSSVVSGDTLRFRLGLRSSWARFKRG